MDHESRLVREGELRPVNLRSRKRHRQQVFLEIWLPLLLMVLLLGAAFGLPVAAGSLQLEAMAQTATIVMALAFGAVGLVLLALIVVMIVAIVWVLNWLPPQSFRLQNKIHRLNRAVISNSDRLAAPLVLVESWSEALKQVFTRRR